MERIWSIREYREDDKKGIFDLRKAVYGEPFNEQQWDWKYSNKPVKVAKIFLAENNGMIVGLRPVMFLPLKVMSRVVIAGLNADVMTHPDFRHRGIFSTLVREAFERVSNEEIEIVFTFPNENSYLGYVKLGWPHICSVPLLAIPLNFNNLVRKYIKTTALQKPTGSLLGLLFKGLHLGGRLGKTDISGFALGRIYSFDNRFDELWYKVSNQHNIAVVRDSRYLRWRYADKPGQEYIILGIEKERELAGYIILKSNVEMFGLKLGLIVDMLTIEDKGITNALLCHAIDYFKRAKMDIIGCLMLKHTAYYKALRKAGFIEVPKPFSPKEFYFVGYTNSSKVADATVYNVDNWFLTFGDIDIV